jgi:DNA uptake protein ComE-like DNA-binding protein
MIERDRASGGYVVLLVAAVVAVLSAFILLAATVQGQAGAALRRLRQDARLELAAQNAQARIGFLLLTEPIGRRAILIGADPTDDPDGAPAASSNRLRSASGRAITPLDVDGAPYRMRFAGAAPADVIVSVQDESGLLNLNAGDEAGVRALLSAHGVSARAAQSAAGALADYVDEDDVRRTYGAEESAYRTAGLPAPLNHNLDTPWSALDALGWRTLLGQAQQRAFFSQTSTAAQNVINVNTAPLAVLMAVYQIDERTAQSMIARRARAPFRSSEEVSTFTGETTRAEAPATATLPGNKFRFVVRMRDASAAAWTVAEGQMTIAGATADRPAYWRGGWPSRRSGAEIGDGVEPGAAGPFPQSANLPAP